MDFDLLAALGTSLGKISTRIAERVGDADGTAPDKLFDECVEREMISLRQAGQTALAETVASIRHPIERALRGGW